MSEEIPPSSVKAKHETSIKQGYINKLNELKDAKTTSLIKTLMIGCILGLLTIISKIMSKETPTSIILTVAAEIMLLILTILIRVWQIRRRYGAIENIILLCAVIIQFAVVQHLSVVIHSFDLETLQN